MEIPKCAKADECSIELKTKKSKGIPVRAVASCVVCDFSFTTERSDKSIGRRTKGAQPSARYLRSYAEGQVPDAETLQSIARAVQQSIECEQELGRPYKHPIVPRPSFLQPDMTPVIE